MRANLIALDNQFLSSVSDTEYQFCAKLAIIELCGWIEEAMDDIILQCSSRTLREIENIDYCSKQIIKRNYGFDYTDNFRKMLMQLIGLSGVEKVEAASDTNKLTLLCSELATLKVIRNQVAHTYTKHNVQVTYSAPSTLLPRLSAIYAGLAEFDKEVSAREW